MWPYLWHTIYGRCWRRVRVCFTFEGRNQIKFLKTCRIGLKFTPKVALAYLSSFLVFLGNFGCQEKCSYKSGIFVCLLMDQWMRSDDSHCTTYRRPGLPSSVVLGPAVLFIPKIESINWRWDVLMYRTEWTGWGGRGGLICAAHAIPLRISLPVPLSIA